MQSPTEKRKIVHFSREKAETKSDLLAVEEPLEIRLRHWNGLVYLSSSLAVTMRTPGADAELALGFLFSEGIIHHPEEIVSIEHIQPRNELAAENTIELTLGKDVKVDFKKLQRHFYTTSSCGVCGKTSIEAIQSVASCPVLPKNFSIHHATLFQLCKMLNDRQTIFRETGGLHASALFDHEGQLLFLQEDVGRHNAFDKVIGHAFRNNWLPLNHHLLLLSGRASFELVQKAVMAGISILAAVGAPSSLAAQLAEESGLTLIGFLKDEKCNIYAHPDRIE